MTKRVDTKKELPENIEIHYIKTPSYRTYHVDGVYGGLTPKGDLYCELYTERNATPQLAVHEITEEGRLGNVIKKEGRSGIIREIECGISLDVSTAYALKEWLERKIEDYEKNKELINKGEKK